MERATCNQFLNFVPLCLINFIAKNTMCRLLYVRNKTGSKISDHLKKFAKIAKNSREYQGHGWGCSYLQKGEWKHYKNILPIWEDNLDQFGTSILLVAHARSAFRNKDIAVENNMPFYDDKYVFIFNGEIHGVKIKADGRIGAEKIYNFIKRFDKGDMLKALSKGVDIIGKQSRYIRAMNIIIANKQRVYLLSQFSEDEGYFTLHYKQTENELIICSEPYEKEQGWNAIKNNTIEVF